MLQSRAKVTKVANDTIKVHQEKARKEWSPAVYAYIHDLENLEANGPSMLGSSAHDQEPVAADGNRTVLFIVISDSHNYGNRLRWISETWGQELSPSLLFATGDAGKHEAETSVRVEQTGCPAHTHDGACCKVGAAVIQAWREMQRQPMLTWAYIVDDDTFVRPSALEEQLKTLDPLSQSKNGTLAAIPGCGEPKYSHGICGGGGAALSRAALESIVDSSPSSYLERHMKTCDSCEMWGDLTLGNVAHAKGVLTVQMPGLNSNRMDKVQFDSALELTEPLMYHYISREEQMNFLQALFNESENASSSGAYDTKECASYRGHVHCSNDPAAWPWS